MAFYHRNSERKRIPHDYRRQEEEVVGSLCRLGSRPVSPKSLLEQEKRIRREIANSNERRRMQSINAGFQSLRALLPHREGEKLSKAAILQNTADYVYQLEHEKTRLLEQNSQLSRRMLNSQHINHDSDGSCSDSPLPKRKKREPADSVDEGIGSSSPSRSENGGDDMKREVVDLRIQLEQERTLRLLLEERLRNLESRLYPAGSRPDSADLIHFQYHSGAEDIKVPINMGHESGLGSPQSQVSSQDVESAHEISLRESSPELSSAEIPEDLSGKNNSMLLQCVDELSLSDVATIPGILLSTGPMNVSSSSFPVEINIASQQATFKGSTSRQNLETIVEAIRHVEGDHMFRDDPTETNGTQSMDREKLSPTEQKYPLTEQKYSSAEQEYSSAEQEYSSAEQKYSSAEQKYSSAEQKYSSAEQKYSSAEQKYSSAEQKYSSAEQKYSSAEQKYSSAEQKYSSAEQKYSSAEQKYSSTEQKYSSTEQKYSSTEQKYSPTEQKYSEQIEQPVLLTDFSFQHQIIRNAPLTQSRPGVIVSNLS